MTARGAVGGPLRVFLVDDHQLFLSGVRAELGDEFEVVGSASEVDAAIELVRERGPDVVLVDVHMPGGGGARVIREVLAANPETRFLALSVSDSPDDVIATIRAGARGYVTKSIAPRELADAIRRIYEGDAVFSPRLAGFVLDAFAAVPVGAVDPELDQLTAREQQVLRLIAAGIRTRRSRPTSPSPSRPSRRTSPRCSGSCSSPIATSWRAGLPSAGSCDERPLRPHELAVCARHRRGKEGRVAPRHRQDACVRARRRSEVPRRDARTETELPPRRPERRVQRHRRRRRALARDLPLHDQIRTHRTGSRIVEESARDRRRETERDGRHDAERLCR